MSLSTLSNTNANTHTMQTRSMTNGIINNKFWNTTINDYIQEIISQAINVNPEFQRLHCWSRKAMQNLIWSILNRFPINQITLFKFRSDENWSVLDGGHRTRTIKGYMNDEFPLAAVDVRSMDLPTRYIKKYFSELPNNDQLKILTTPLCINQVIVEDGREDLVSLMFDDLQNAVPLNAGERVSAAAFNKTNCLGEFTFGLLNVNREPRGDQTIAAREAGIRMRDIIKANLFTTEFGWNENDINNDNKFGLGKRSANLARWVGIVALFVSDGHHPELLEATWSQSSGVLNQIFHQEMYAQWNNETINKVERLLTTWVETIKYFNDNLNISTYGNYKKDGLLSKKIESAHILVDIAVNNGITNARRNQFLQLYTLLAENTQLYNRYRLSIGDGGAGVAKGSKVNSSFIDHINLWMNTKLNAANNNN